MSSSPGTGKRRARSRSSNPAGGVWLYGRHAVAAALANPHRKLLRVVAVGDVATAFDGGAPKAETVDPSLLDALLPPKVPHQGVAALCAPLEPSPIEMIAAETAAGRPALLLDQVTDPQNVGAILRSAAAFGASGVVMQDRHAPPETGALAKAASGALDRIPVARVVNLARALDLFREHGVWSVALAGDAERGLDETPMDRPLALALGAEGTGVRRLTRERCDLAARIPIDAEQESLNVSAAAAVALYAATRAGR
ncbi:MAG: 23S rRNA (guanosine(2251)-2'-O)-methyltransferase RlmB [Pseudomonadota bacterium]